MTSTIAPAPQAYLLAHSDPRKRLEEYKTAFGFYLRLLQEGLVDKLVYADNSGHDLSQLKDIARTAGMDERCEFISFNTPAIPEVNRFFLEVELLKTALRESTMIEEGDDIWKVTGRYVIRNIAAIVRRAPPSADFYVNCRNRPIRTLDFYLVRFNRRAFQGLIATDTLQFKDRQSDERALRQRLDHSTAGFSVGQRFSEPPQVIGTRGSDGAPYTDFKGNAKFIARRWINRLAPNWWI